MTEGAARVGAESGHHPDHGHDGAGHGTDHGSHTGHVDAQAHARPDGHHGYGGHGDHGAHAGHSEAMFRDRFWWSLILTIPVVATSDMVMDWFGYELDFAGVEWIGPVLG